MEPSRSILSKRRNKLERLRGRALRHDWLTATITKDFPQTTTSHKSDCNLTWKVLPQGQLPSNSLFNLGLSPLLLLITVSRNYCFKISDVIFFIFVLWNFSSMPMVYTAMHILTDVLCHSHCNVIPSILGKISMISLVWFCFILF